MHYLAGLPPELYEVINAALAAVSWVAWVICLRYLLTGYTQFRMALSVVDSFWALRSLRLAIGFTIFLCGEAPRMTWLWLARYLGNTGRDTVWMAQVPWVFVPVVASLVSVLGLACVVRALTPLAWGRWGYVLALGAAIWAVLLTQVIR